VSAVATRVARALVVLVLVGAPPAAHLALVMRRGTAVAAILIAVQAALMAWIALSSLTQRAFRVGSCALVALFVLILSRFTVGGPLVASAVPHAMAYLTLLVVFAGSLQPGREAIVTILARKARGALSGEIVRYTRRLGLVLVFRGAAYWLTRIAAVRIARRMVAVRQSVQSAADRRHALCGIHLPAVASCGTST
jgi:hypothetical protein